MASALDNIQDATVTYRVASKLSKLMTKRGLPGVGQITGIGQFLNEWGKYERLVASPWAVRKAKGRRLVKRAGGKVKVSGLRAKGAALVPFVGDALTVAQTADDLFGVGIKLGPVFGVMNDVVFGSLMAWRGHAVEMRLPDGALYDVTEDYANWFWAQAAKLGGGPLAPAWEVADWVHERAMETGYGPVGPILQGVLGEHGEGKLGEGHLIATNSDVSDAISLAQGVAASVLERAWDSGVGLLGALGELVGGSKAPEVVNTMTPEDRARFLEGASAIMPEDWGTPSWLRPDAPASVPGPPAGLDAETLGMMWETQPEVMGAARDAFVDGLTDGASALGVGVVVEPPEWARAAWWAIEQRREPPADADTADAVRYVEEAGRIFNGEGTGAAGLARLDEAYRQAFGRGPWEPPPGVGPVMPMPAR